MSNQQVGPVFERVIQEVCDASQVDFEESGVDQQTLLDLRKSWQKKLSSLGVAHFPWDPAPQPAATQPTPPQSQTPIPPPAATVPSNAPPPPQIQQHVPAQPPPQSISAAAPPIPAPTAASQTPRIKIEPGVNGQHPGYPAMNGNMMPSSSTNPISARERAANMLHQRYGAAAANSVSQMQAQGHAGVPMQGQVRPQSSQAANGQGPTIKTEHSYTGVSQAPLHSLGNAQTDGAGDALSEWKAEAARRRAAVEQNRGKADRLIRDRVRCQMLQMEGGGLLAPLTEYQPSTPSMALDDAASAMESSASTTRLRRGQFDGADDEEKFEDDEDAINSDLDDPDDLIAEDNEGDDAIGEVMLCTYDKVQRVKNKWKCILKDGILTTGGKEYVFQKGQGEFEW